jgi:hypothetical protein
MMRPIAGLACTVLVGACGAQTSDPENAGAAPDTAWRTVAESPLSPRDMAVAVSLGDRVLVVGGGDGSPCPPNADCAVPDEVPLLDGAIYDPAADSWAPIADAPVHLGGFTGHVSGTGVIGDVAYFLLPSVTDEPPALLSYDVSADAWDELPPPPIEGWPALVAAGDELVAYMPSHEEYGERIAPTDPLPPDVVYDPMTDTWDELPVDPHRPSFDRKMVATAAGLVLLAKDLVPEPGVDPPIVRAAVLDATSLAAGEWSTLPDGEILWTDGFGWTGGLLVNPDQGSADGGEINNWGSSYPAGGILDPATGTWSELPEPPGARASSPDELPIELFSSGSRTAVYGRWALDVPSGPGFPCRSPR